MRISSILILILVIFLFSCKEETQTNLEGQYVMVGDHSKQFIIKDSMIIKIDTSQLNSQQTPLFFMNDEGDFEEAKF